MRQAFLIFRSTLRGQRLSIALLSLGLMLFAFLMAATFDAFGESTLELMESMPQGFQALLKASSLGGSPSMAYLGIGYRHPVMLLVLSGFVVAASSSAMAREIEKGSIFLILSRPVPRLHMLVAKLGSLMVGLALFLSFALLGTWIGVTVYDVPDVEYVGVMRVLLNAFFLSLSLTGIAFVVSASNSDGGRAIALSAGILVVLFFIDFLASTWAVVEPIGFVSPFHYYDPVRVMSAGAVPALHLGVLAAFAVAGLTAAAVIFNRRDIP